MSEVGSISPTLPLTEPGMAPREQDRSVSVAKRVLLLFSVGILSTICGCYWLFQAAMVSPAQGAVSPPWEVLTGVGASTVKGGLSAQLILPLVAMMATWFSLALMAVRRVRVWAAGFVEEAQEEREVFSRQLKDLETRLKVANHAARVWQDRADEFAGSVKEVEQVKAELEGRLDQHALQAKSLAQQQMVLARSKDVLEKRVEARTRELQGQRLRYESILHSAGEGICSFDLEGRITFINPAVVAMTGWSAEELLGRRESEMFEDFGSKPEALFGDEGGTRVSPPMFRRKNGSLFPVETVRTPVEEKSRQVGTVLIFKDVTERTLADDQLAHKAAELARSNAELEQFAFVASHDLQEPLRKIQAFGDRLKDRCVDALKPESRDYLARMQSAAARMQVLIDSLLTYSRVLTRAQPHAPVDLNEITREVLGDLEVRIEKAGAVVAVEKLPTIEGDGLQIRQLLQNLLSNALKFQPAGNVPKVRVSARLLPYGRIQSRSQGNTEIVLREETCELTVQDNGIGFDEIYLNRLFTVFQRLHGRNEYEGTGIGLAVCRKIVSRHRGAITATSTPGQGASFIVTLPVKQPQPQNPS